LTDGSRVSKHSLRPEAYGTVDELNSTLGLVYFYIEKSNHNEGIQKLIRDIQNDLFDLGADLSTPISEKKPKYPPLRIKENQITLLEKKIDEYNNNINPLNSFILPGGSEASAWLHLARTIARRAERIVSSLANNEMINNQSLIYLNRLSDLLFVLCRVMNENGKNDVLWIPGLNQK
jgi:cob(I)alamin adenosyltransferase